MLDMGLLGFNKLACINVIEVEITFEMSIRDTLCQKHFKLSWINVHLVRVERYCV